MSAPTAGEVRLPGGRMPLRAIRSLVLFLAASIAVAVPLALIRAAVRVSSEEPSAAVERALVIASDGERAVRSAQHDLAVAPEDPRAMARLALAYLQRVRETADPTYYAKADELVRRASERAGADPAVQVAAGSLALGRHDFTAALRYGTAAARSAPKAPSTYAVLVDALVELGRYDEAVAALQTMVDLRPDLASFSRVSYLRELHGDLGGAVDAMRRAVQAGAPQSEAAVWSDVQLGHLLFAQGDLGGAAAAYEDALRRIDGSPHALAGIARVRAVRDDLAGAARLYEAVVRRLPLPEYLAALGDVYSRMGEPTRAAQQYALVVATQRLFAASGVRTDIDLALFGLDHGGDVAAALNAARAEHLVRPSVQVADVLAWAEYRSGDIASAVRHSAEAMRLGSRDPRMLAHARAIAEAAR